MKLFFAPPSPYSRKVRVLARELCLASTITEVSVHTTPVAPAAEVTEANPLSKIPTLMTDSGMVLYDSRVICDYLIEMAEERSSLTSQQSKERAARPHALRWQVARRHALADGILDAGLAHRYETVLRPKELHWQPWLEAQHNKITTAVALVATDLPDIEDSVGIDAIAIACALGWLAFRMPDIDWRVAHPSLAKFADAMAERRSMTETRP